MSDLALLAYIARRYYRRIDFWNLNLTPGELAVWRMVIARESEGNESLDSLFPEIFPIFSLCS